MSVTPSAHHLHPVQQPGREIARVLRPATLNDALTLLADNPQARLLAGGTDLLLELARHGPGPAVTVIDVTALEELREVTITDGHIRLGAMTTHNDVVRHPTLRALALPLAQACLEIGSPQLRNRATIVGNVATASPANDTISALLALDATVELRSLSGVRTLPLAAFLTGFRQTDRHADEIITALSFPALTPNRVGLWAKLGNRTAQAISVLHLGVVIERDADGTVTDARLALGSAAATVVRLTEAEASLCGRPLTDDSLAEAADLAQAAVTPLDDVRATAEYRTEIIPTLVTRALRAVGDNLTETSWPHDPPCLRQATPPVSTPTTIVDDDVPVSIMVNGTSVSAAGAASRSLLEWLRDDAGMTAAKEGCAEGECGSCTVIVNGAAVMSCLVNAAQADGADVLTAEGVGANGPSRLQQAFVDEFAVQCGFCIPGFIMAGTALLAECPQPDDAQIALGLSGNLCRCTGYYPIADAIRTASRALESEKGRP